MRTPLSGREYAAIQSLFAAVSTFAETSRFLEKRAKDAAPGTWRDLRLLGNKSESVMDNILRTVPDNKLRLIMKDVQNVRLYIKVEPPGLKSLPDKAFTYVPTAALNELMAIVTEDHCMICDKSPTEARRCEIRRIIEEILPHEMPGKDGEYCRLNGLVLGIDEGA